MNVDVSALHPKARRVVEVALECGWLVRNTPTNTGRRGVVLYSEAYNITIMVPPLRQWHQGTTKAMIRKVRRYGRPAQPARRNHSA